MSLGFQKPDLPARETYGVVVYLFSFFCYLLNMYYTAGYFNLAGWFEYVADNMGRIGRGEWCRYDLLFLAAFFLFSH